MLKSIRLAILFFTVSLLIIASGMFSMENVGFPGNVPVVKGVDNNQIRANYSLPNIYVNASETLHSNLTGNNITIESGVVLTTDGWNIFANNMFENLGKIITGTTPPKNYTRSYGGSGGGAQSQAENAGQSAGFSTIAPGGMGSSSNSQNGGNGATPQLPSNVNDSVMFKTWYSGDLSNFLSGAGAEQLPSLSYSGGAYGLAIVAGKIFPGQIDAMGANGSGTGSGLGLIGGGGGGVILIAYGSGGLNTHDQCNVSGGHGVSGINGQAYSGNGGMGQIIQFNISRGNFTIPHLYGLIVFSGLPTKPLKWSNISVYLAGIATVALIPVYYWKRRD